MNTVLLFIVVLGSLIFFHELGHFLVARLFGVGVEKFSLGFGPRIIGKKIGRTDYRLSLIPLGGYVKMVGDEPDCELPPEDLPFSFTHKHVLKRSLIVFAGPFANALLALLIFIAIFYYDGLHSTTPVVREIDTNSSAEQVGLQKGDWIEAVDGQTVGSWREIDTILNKSTGEPATLDVSRQGQRFTYELTPRKAVAKNVYGDEFSYYEFGISEQPELMAIVGGVVENNPAGKAGLEIGDQIISIDDQPIGNWMSMQKMIAGSNGKALRFGIKRNQEKLVVEITPEMIKVRNLIGISSKNYRIGITPMNLITDEANVNIELSFGQAVKHSFFIFGRVNETFFDFLKAAFRGKVSRELFGGPIRIAQMAQKSAEMGIVNLFFFIAAISLQLAILNLLPIPVLDGGHLLFYSIEAIKRGPLSVRARETAQQIGLFLLLLLMVFVLYNDIDLTWFN